MERSNSRRQIKSIAIAPGTISVSEKTSECSKALSGTSIDSMARPSLSASQSYSTYYSSGRMGARHHAKTANAGITKCVLPRSWVANFFEHGDRKSDIFEDDAERTYRPYSGLGRSSIANITLVRDNATVVSTRQANLSGPRTRGRLRQPYTVLGLWMIDQDCCGVGVRESFSPSPATKLLRSPLLQLIGRRDEEISPSLLEGLYRLAG
jgi:hypothetical protein